MKTAKINKLAKKVNKYKNLQFTLLVFYHDNTFKLSIFNTETLNYVHYTKRRYRSFLIESDIDQEILNVENVLKQLKEKTK